MKKLLFYIVSIILLLNIQSMSVFADNIKTLYFSGIDNNLYYDAKVSPNTNYFMVFDEMVANQVYTDQLKIRNDANKDYELFFQIIPKEGLESQSLKLLKAIDMKISYGDELLYEGSADAIVKRGGIDVSHMVSIGQYKPGDEKMLNVEVKLNHSEPLLTTGCYYVTDDYTIWENADFAKNLEPTRYASQQEARDAATLSGSASVTYHENSIADTSNPDSLWGAFTETTWKFYATNDDEVIPINPGTGDSTNKNLYMTVAIISLAILIVVGISISKSKDKLANTANM